MVRIRFSREFDVPSLFHHLSQRFDLVHKSENIEFIKDLVKEYPGEAIELILDEVQIYKSLFISEQMKERYSLYNRGVLFLDSLLSPKFMHNYFIIISGVNANGEIEVFGIIISSKDIEELKSCFSHFAKDKQPGTLVIDSEPYILEACK